MRKRKAIVLFALIMSLVLIPGTVLAGHQKNAGNAKKNAVRRFVGGEKLKKAIDNFSRAIKIKEKDGSGESSLNIEKSIVRAFVDEVWGLAVSSYRTDDPGVKGYSKDVWDELSSIYSDAIARINKATDDDDLIQGSFMLLPAQYYIDACRKIIALGEMNSQIFPNGKKDIPDGKKRKKKEIESYFRDFKKKSYNSFYWGNIRQKRYSLLKQLENVKTFSDFSRVNQDFGMINVVSTSTTEEEFSADDKGGVKVGGREVIALNWVYTKSEVKKLKKAILEWSGPYVAKVTKKLKKNKAGKIRKWKKEFERKTRKDYDVDSMMDRYEAFEEKVEIEIGNIAKGGEFVDVAEVERCKNRLYTEYMRYRISDYSEKNWGKITDIYSASIFKLENITMQRELKDSIWKKAIGDMKKVPTKVPELKKKKIRYIKILKGLLRSPRYNKKKLKSIVTKAVARIKKTKDVDKIDEIFTAYELKTEKSIKTFRIKVKKVGAGKASGSKTVRYGSSFKVVLAPFAGHRISEVRIDGKSVKLKSRYEFNNIRKSHKLSIIFQ